MVYCLLEFHFLKEILLRTYCYTFFLLRFLSFLPIEKICLLGFNIFSSSYSQQSSFLRSPSQKILPFGSLTFQKSVFFLIPRLLCFLAPHVITTFRLPSLWVFNQFLLVYNQK